MSDDAEGLRLLPAAGGGGGEFVRPADQQVTCGGVAAALGANIRKLRHLCPDGTPQGCGEENCEWARTERTNISLLSFSYKTFLRFCAAHNKVEFSAETFI